MKKYFLSLIAFFIMIAAAQASPEADFKKISKEYTFHPDGSYDVRCYKELTIKSHIALNGLYGETFIIYNPNYQEIKFNSSYTVQADGNKITTPPNAFNEVLPSAAANAPAYNHLQEMVVTHTGLEIGATIFLDYTLRTKAGYLPAEIKPETDDVLQEQSPIQEYTVKINIPASLPLNYILTGSSVKPKVVENGETKQYSWVFKNIPAASHEPNVPGNQINVPRLTTCSYQSQEAALKTLSGSYTNNTDETVKNTVKELIGNKTDKLEKIIAIQKYVTGQIASCKLNPEQTGYSTRTPAEVIRTAYGTSMEKNRLLVSMLQCIGEKPEITVLYPAFLKKGIKGINPITNILVKVDDRGKPLFISAMNYPTESLELNAGRNDIWMISDNEILPLNILENSSTINYQADIKLSAEKANISGKLAIKGALIPIMDDASTENHIKSLSSQAGKTISTELISADRRNVEMNFTAEKELSSTHNYFLYELPVVRKAIETWSMNSLNSKRKNQFELPYPVAQKYEYTITLSPDMVLKTEPENIDIIKSFGQLHISIAQKDRTVTVKKEFRLNKAILSPAEYVDFRNMMNIWNNKNNKNLIISALTNK